MSRIKVNTATNKLATGPVNFPDGLTGVAATFTGNVTVGGTLSYEDVQNIDSTGIVTARTGIKVLAEGIDAVGIITASQDVQINGKSAATTGKAIAMAMIFG